MRNVCLTILALLALLVVAPPAQAAAVNKDRLCAQMFPNPERKTESIKLGKKTTWNWTASAELICTESFGVPEGLELSPAAICDITAFAYGLTKPTSTFMVETVCFGVSAGTEGLGRALTGKACDLLGKLIGTSKVWLGMFVQTAVCIGLLDGVASSFGVKLESDHEVNVARDILGEHKCLQMRQRKARGTDWRAVDCPRGWGRPDPPKRSAEQPTTAPGTNGSPPAGTGGSVPYDANQVMGRVVRAADGTSYYVDKRGAKHWIPDGGTYECIAAQTGTWPHTVPRNWLTQPEYERAQCVRAQPGNIVRHTDGDAYLLNADWTRGGIPTAGSYQCFRAAGHAVVDAVPRYYLLDLAQAGDATFAGGTCVVRRPDGTAYVINNEGRREWIPDTPTWDCEAGRGVPVMNPGDGFINSLAEVGWHFCLNKANLRGKVLRHAEGDAHYVHPDDTRTWIPDEFTYNCRTRAGTPVADTRWRQYVNAFGDRGWDWCFDVNTFRGRYIVHPDGDRHFVGDDGVRHWVPADRAACMNARFGAPATVRWRQYITNLTEREWAICGDTLYRNQLLDRGQWLSSSNGYKLVMQGDGNLVLYNRSGRAIWAVGVNGSARHVKLHDDGCLARVNFDGQWSWQTGCNKGGDRLVMQTDGNLVLYAGSKPVWASNTVGQ